MFFGSGFQRTLCGSTWGSLTGNNNAFNNLGSSTARYGCCLANRYMSSPEGTGTFEEADFCSDCPAGIHVSLATSVPNDELTCFIKMPDGCKGFGEQSAVWTNRDCYPRKAVDDWIAGGAKKDNVVQKFGPIENWDMSQVTDMGYLFHWKRTLNSDLSSWVVSSVTTLVGST